MMERNGKDGVVAGSWSVRLGSEWLFQVIVDGLSIKFQLIAEVSSNG